MAIVKHLDQAKKLTVSLKASVNFLSLWESMWVCKKVPQSRSTSVLRKDKEIKKHKNNPEVRLATPKLHVLI